MCVIFHSFISFRVILEVESIFKSYRADYAEVVFKYAFVRSADKSDKFIF